MPCWRSRRTGEPSQRGARVNAWRRALLCAAAAGAWAPHALAAGVVRKGTPILLPRDFGSHEDFRTEWWYVTGWLFEADEADRRAAANAVSSEPYGFQLTVFRTRTDLAAGNPSRFAARQLLFAHAALSDPVQRRLRHDQRIARAGFGIAEASSRDTDLRLRDWSLRRVATRSAADSGHHYLARADSPSQGFALDLRLDATQPVLLQGDAGYSRKGPEPAQASHYLSEPQLAVSGSLRVDGRTRGVAGRAWLDHEWSEALLHPEAVGWDWVGMNLDDASALTAFRLRRQDGSALWAGGSHRTAGGPPRAFATDEVRFTPLATWTSPATRATYPVRWCIDTPAGSHEVRARLDAQELDTGGSTGNVYWEGLSDLHDSAGQRVGRGYLEMTGYAAPLRL